MSEPHRYQHSVSSSAAVEQELEAIDATFKRVSKTKAKARAFLTRAGILNKNGKQAKAYR
ncbi:hypothetical protein [Verrucomicrobium spinosum]|uniref:hypothetical protein n=1 Tax=Verrucomicrobium spinosum TaxID=2736 RepID=UPI000492441C|nr:hypothetical protein [Verrucomicrobium spinosum]